MPAAKSLSIAAAILFAAALGAAAAQAATLAEEQAACEGDAFEYCSAYIPNREEIRGCLYEYREQISPACRALVAPQSR